MQKIIHKADSRGVAEHGWLRSRHTFSFAGYYDKKRMGFGKLRVLNDDNVDPGAGFATHPHDNMEIVSIPLSGSLRHVDSMGNSHLIRAGDVQIMSAGTGIRHSEYNGSDEEPVNFLQIWVLPKQRDIPPRYDQKTIDPHELQNKFALLVSPDAERNSVTINQDAWFSLAQLKQDSDARYLVHGENNGCYVFVIDGRVEIDDVILESRDAVGITDVAELEIHARADSRVLLIEVPH